MQQRNARSTTLAMLAAATLLIAALVGGCAGVPREPASPLVGRWQPTEAQLGGRPLPVAGFDGAVLEMTADRYAFGIDHGHYVPIDGPLPTKMDVVGDSGPNAGRTIPAIYDVAGDALTICYQLGAGERPDAFRSPGGSRILLVRYRRIP